MGDADLVITESGIEPSGEDVAASASLPTSNVLTDAIRRVRDLNPALADSIEREVNALRDSRTFGLVFERHLPESVRLIDFPVKRGVQVSPRHPKRGQELLRWKVLRVVGGREAGLAYLMRPAIDGQAAVEEPDPVPVRDLIVVREFGEPVFPGLKRVGEPIRRADQRLGNHVVINGENYHALQLLKMTHKRKVDLIYIDPPYNTGNQGWIYNDRYVAEQDGHKHAKWLSFMERRLTLARDLLKDTGVIVVAIGDEEHHRLRMLLDQLFGAKNFVSDIVWNGSRKNDASFISNAADYMLVYAKDAERLLAARGKWSEPKPWANEVLEAGVEAWEASGHDADEATRRLKAWYARQPRGKFTASQKHYSLIDSEGRVFSEADPGFPGGQGPRYDVIHPVTGLPCRVPENGWRFNEDVFKSMIAEGRVHFRADHTALPRPKTFLHEQLNEKAESVFYSSRKAPAQYVAKILGDKRFPYPKDHEVLMRWFRMACPADGIILDFFAGSGTSVEAVIRLNEEDAGTRQVIAVTNNELAAKDAAALTKQGLGPGDPEWEAKGVFEYVTRPRITTVVTGVRPDGSVYSDGLAANVDFFQLTYLDPDRVSGAREFGAIAPLLWMMAGSPPDFVEREPERRFAVAAAYAVLTDIDSTEAFLKELFSQPQPPPLVFVVTDSPSEFEHISSLLPDTSRPVRLYESYLRNFLINVEVA